MYEMYAKHWTTLKKLIYLKAIRNATGGAEYTGDIVQFETARSKKLKNLIVSLSPIQDLHGYESPWPAGGGVNKFDLAASFTEGETVSNNGITATYSNGYLKVTGTNTSGSAFNIVYKYISGTLGAGTYISPFPYCSVRASVDGGSNGNYQIAFTASTSVSLVAFYVNISANATNLDWNIPMMIVSGSTRPTEYAPYSNLCPITGRTGASAWRTGKNIFGGSVIQGDVPINVVAGQKYTVSAKLIDSSTDTYLYIRKWLGEEYELVSRVITGTSVTARTFTAEEGYEYTLWSNASYTNITDVMVELGESASTYEAYTGNLFSVEFPALGANRWDEQWEVMGTSIASKNNIPCTAGKWYYINVSPANGWRFYDANNNIIATSYTNYRQAPEGAVSMWFRLGSAYGTEYNNDVIVAETTGTGVAVPYEPYTNTVYSGTVDIVTGELRVRHEYPSYNGETLLGEWMSSMDKYVAGTTPTTGAQVVDLGGTETIYHLSPQQVMSLVGHNTVWSADGEVTVRV